MFFFRWHHAAVVSENDHCVMSTKISVHSFFVVQKTTKSSHKSYSFVESHKNERNKLQYLYLLIIIHNGIIMEQTTPLNGTIIRDPAWKKKKKGLGPWIMVTALLLGLGLAFYAGQRSGSTSRTGPGGTTRGGTIATASLTMSSNEAVFESSRPCLHFDISCRHNWECCSYQCASGGCTRD